jgi:hypothetical protein
MGIDPGAATDRMAISSGHIYLSIADTDSGWGETVNPSDDNVKIFMNGWKTLNTNQSSYTLFVMVGRQAADPSLTQYPPNSATTLSVAYTNGQTTLTVADGSIFKAGDMFALIGYTMAAAITSVSGNVLTVANIGQNIPSGAVVARCDNGTIDLRNLNYCKNNVAPNYEGYKLHYKLANPEPITDLNVHIEGEIWDLVKGDNYVTVDSGIVLNEVINPKLGDATYYYINSLYGNEYSPFQNPAESINVIYKNQQYNNTAWTNLSGTSYSPNGRVKGYITIANFDTNATYTVDYQILKTINAQSFGSLSLSYPQSIVNSLNGLSRAVEGKQPRDSALDDLIDLSIYEEGNIQSPTVRAIRSASLGGCSLLQIVCKFNVRKKTLPMISLQNVLFYVRDSTGFNNTVIPDQILVNMVDKDYVLIGVYIKDGTIATNAMNYGCACTGRFIADCRGRV